MKKILVTGASGAIGLWVLKYLLSEGKYEITAIDLKSKETYKKLKKYHKRMNVIYGDICDPILIDALVKDHDYVIHLAGIMPPLSNLSTSFGDKIDYIGTENIVRSISFYNPECFLIYPSTTSLYAKSKTEINSKSKIEYDTFDYYSKTKEKCENLIKQKLKNYVIYRLPFVLGDLKTDRSIYLYKLNEELELITTADAAYALVKSIDNKIELNKKIKLLSGGKGCRINSTELFIRILKTYGFSFNILWNKIFQPCKYTGNIFKQDQKLEEILKYQNDSVDSYFMRLTRKKDVVKRKINRFFAKPTIKKLERSLNK